MTDEEWIAEAAATLARDARAAGAWLFGSRAGGRPHAWSDTDLAVLIADAVPSSSRLRAQLELSAAVRPPPDGSALDVVVLNEAPPELVLSVLESGRLLFARDPRLPAALRETALRENLDLAPYRRMAAEAQDRRFAEGRFGNL